MLASLLAYLEIPQQRKARISAFLTHSLNCSAPLHVSSNACTGGSFLAGTALPPRVQNPWIWVYLLTWGSFASRLTDSVISEATLAITSPRSVRLSPVYISRVSCSSLYSFLRSLNHILNLYAFRATCHVIKFYVFWQMPNDKYLYYTLIWNSLITLKILRFFYLVFSPSQESRNHWLFCFLFQNVKWLEIYSM